MAMVLFNSPGYPVYETVYETVVIENQYGYL